MSTGGGCWVAEAVPSTSFTPQEHSVELLRVIFSQNTTPVLVNPSEKPFLVLSLLRDYAGPSLRHSGARAVLALPNESQVTPWREFLERSTNLEPSGIAVLTHNQILQEDADLENISLLILDAAHVLVTENKFFKETYPAIKASVSARVVTLTAFLFNGDKTLRSLGTRLSKLESMYGNRVETSCDVLTTLRYVSKPRFGILSYITPKDPDEMELKIEKSLEGFISFLGTHRFSLEETYGDDFDDLIQEIPNPTQLPLKLIDEFLSILRTCGVWCAERAALLLTIKICKLKTREKYERHYLLLSVLYSEMLKICKLCDDAFGELSDREKMTKYAKPKMLRFLSVLLQYKPEHIQDFPVLEQALEEQQPKKNSSPPSEEEDGEEARSKEEAQPPLQPPKEDRPPPPPPSRFRSKSKKYNSYDDPNALCGVIFVQNKFLAQILFHYLKEMSKSDHRFSFLTPQYAVILKSEEESEETDEGLLNHRKQEEALRRFRMRECNVLISNSLLEVGIDCVRCNLVLAFDVPDSFHTYAHYKVKAKSALSWFLSLCKEGEIQGYLGSLREYASIEKSLVDRCMYKDPSLEERLTSDANNEGLLLPPFTPKTLAHPTLSLKNAILLLNRYCAKLPSDTFTRLTPLASVRKMSENTFLCGIQLPINCPLKRIILGRPMPNETLAKRAAAYAAVLELHKMGEVDHFMNPLGKDGHASYLAARYFKQANKQGRNHHHKKTPPEKKTEDVLSDKLQEITLEDEETPSSSKVSEIKEIKAPKNGEEAKKDPLDSLPRPGTTKRRQYYYKKIASCLKSPKAAAVENSQGLYRLYTLDMHLSCPIPDDQNTRGRKIYPPEDSPQGFGFLVQTPLPPICPFPIYTRSGEVLVEIKERDGSLSLSQEQLDLILCFHRYTFSKVLRLEKYPMQFTPERSHNSILMLPLCKSGDTTDIDWEFLERIKEENEKKVSVVSDEDRAGYTFRKEDYMDAVIMPWYRNQDQPQYFYVAEICDHLDPTSDFPGQGFETFSKYYQTKYGIGIQNLEQPLLDVDHTSHRLNFLTPRYVNRKGVALPTSSEETKRNKRENLEQKQILVPELCQIHPFPGCLWRQTVSLPCILYRLNGLLIADDLRSLIAREMTLGKPVLPQDFVWPPLDFGWTLADVLKNREASNALALNGQENPKKSRRIVNSTTHVIITETLSKRHNNTNSPAIEEIHDDDEETAEGESNKKEEDLTSLSDRLMNKMNEEDNKLKQKQLEIGTWSNELMEGVVNGGRSRRRPFIKFQDEFDEEDLELLLDPNMALPDNLTLLNNELLPRVDHEASKGGSKDWGTGIEQKIFRVGSPTFFSNPNIHIPGMMDEDDDLDGLSCSDSEDDDYYYEKFDTYRNRKSTASGTALDSVTQDGSGRIEFRGENMAEAIEDETEENLRVESLARNLEEEAKMLSEVPWDEIEGGGEEEDPGREKSLVEPLELNVLVLKENESFNRYESFPEKSPGSEYPRLEVGESESVDEESLVESFKNEFGINAMDRLEPIEFPQKTEEEEDVVYGVLPRDSDKKMEFHFDEQPELSSHPGPSPSIILQGLTMSNSNDAINLERLETIGDSFLKYAITSYLFKAYDSVHEGRLSHLRSKQVSNLHLFKLGRKKRLGECMIATKFEPHDNWLPPSYHVPPELEQALIESGVPANLWNMAEFPSADFGRMTTKEIVELIQEKSLRLARPKDSSVQDLPSFVPYNLLTQHSIPDKSIADCVEALIGAYLISCGQRGALLFMTWLGLKVLPPDEGNEKDEGGSSKASCSSVSIGRELSFFLSGYEEFEDLIGYKFRDRALLLQSFSHASYYPNRITDCYQRLEFLGDAILDYLITRHLYEDPRMHSPGALTDLRSALVNNTIFAFLAVKFQFHKYFKHFSPGLATVIDRFVKLQVQNEYKVFDEFYLIEDEDEATTNSGSGGPNTHSEEAEDIEVPKALGDIFESVAGAIFLDSGQSLDAVWAIYYRMMRSEIEQFSSNVPKSPIRELLELEPETAKFGKPEKLADGKRVRVSVEVFGKGTYKGIGRNYRIAKCTAAKCALRALKKSQHK